jgi:hypothetical protein
VWGLAKQGLEMFSLERFVILCVFSEEVKKMISWISAGLLLCLMLPLLGIGSAAF